jgi:hypothetical protein
MPAAASQKSADLHPKPSLQVWGYGHNFLAQKFGFFKKGKIWFYFHEIAAENSQLFFTNTLWWRIGGRVSIFSVYFFAWNKSCNDSCKNCFQTWCNIHMFLSLKCHLDSNVFYENQVPTRKYNINSYTHTYIHTFTNTYIHTYIHTYLHGYVNPCTHTFICTYKHTWTHTYICMYICKYLPNKYIHSYNHSYIHMYV